MCQLWRDVAVQDPILWCNIAFSTSQLSTIRCAAEFLRRSRGAALNIQIFDIQNHGTTAHSVSVAGLMEEIARQSHRIVEFEAVGFSELVSEALVHPADILDWLTITGRASEELPIVFGGRIPKLKRLTLSNPTGWKLHLFQDVTKVALFCSGDNIRMSSLIDFLDGAQNLQVLSLSRYRGYDRRIVRRSVTLPSLRELNLSFCDASQIIGCLNLPPSAHISILSGPELRNQHIFQYLPDSPGFRNFLSDSRSLTITLNAADNELYLSTCHRDKPSCFLRVYDDRKRLDNDWILRSIDTASRFKPLFNIESLTVSTGDHTLPWGAWLSNLNRLVRLEVRSVDLEDLMFALRPSQAGRGRVPCRSLRYLSIKGGAAGAIFESSTLRSCLLARATAGFPVFRLRLRTKEWADVMRGDQRWKELVLSQGEIYLILLSSLFPTRHVRGFGRFNHYIDE